MYCIEHFPTVRQNQHSSPRFQMMQMNNPKRLLFVDDESSIREMLPVILRRYGFQVTVAATVSEALQEITSNEFDLLLSDLNIESESDGYVVVRAMRATNPRCVIVILTGYPPLDTSMEKIHHNVDEYIAKPASADALIAILADRLAARKQEDAKELIKRAGQGDT
jgi:DNA-binding NtrC family response regulator